jgi:hypothetical protein
MKTLNPSRFPATRAAILASACGLLATPVTAATFNWSRGVAGSFSWNNSTGANLSNAAGIAINGNGNLVLTNSSTITLNLNGGIMSSGRSCGSSTTTTPPPAATT